MGRMQMLVFVMFCDAFLIAHIYLQNIYISEYILQNTTTRNQPRGIGNRKT